MKKSKADRLIKKFSAEAEQKAYAKGRKEERLKWEKYLPRPDQDGITWLDTNINYGKTLSQVVALERNACFGNFGIESPPLNRYFPYIELRFEAVPMAMTIANGQQIRWFNWKPVGPYPASELAIV